MHTTSAASVCERMATNRQPGRKLLKSDVAQPRVNASVLASSSGIVGVCRSNAAGARPPRPKARR